MLHVAAKQSLRESRNYGNRDNQGQRDGYGNRDRDVTEKLPHLKIHDKQRNENHHCRQRGDENGAPYLLRAQQSCKRRFLPLLAHSIDVLQDDNCSVDDHANGKRNAGERDHVDRASEKRHRDERRDDGNRYRQTDDQGCAYRFQEYEQDRNGDGAAYPDILDHQLDRRIDIHGFIIELTEHQTFLGNRPRIQFGDCLAYTLHRLDDIGADLSGGVDCNRRMPVGPHTRRRLLIAVLDRRDIANQHPPDTAGAGGRAAGVIRPQYNVADGLYRIELCFSSNDVSAFAFLYITASDGHIREP